MTLNSESGDIEVNFNTSLLPELNLNLNLTCLSLAQCELSSMKYSESRKVLASRTPYRFQVSESRTSSGDFGATWIAKFETDSDWDSDHDDLIQISKLVGPSGPTGAGGGAGGGPAL